LIQENIVRSEELIIPPEVRDESEESIKPKEYVEKDDEPKDTVFLT